MSKLRCPVDVVGDCTRAECAWWNTKEAECIIMTIGLELTVHNERIISFMEMLARK